MFILLYLLLSLNHTLLPQDTLHVSFVLDMRQPLKQGWLDPANDRVGLRGDLAPLNWGQSSYASDENQDGLYEVTLPFVLKADSAVVAFKIKVDGSDHPDDGWQAGRNHFFTLLKDEDKYITLAWQDQAAPPKPSFSGTIDIIEEFESSPLKSRSIYVYLPPDYHSSESKYPVLYMHDGQNIFDASSAGQEWRMDEWAEQLIAEGTIQPMIIVGIGNTSDRIAEYTPTAQARSSQNIPMGGLGNEYTKLLIQRIKPFIDQRYRTLPDRTHTALGGSSLGGLISMYMGLQHPEMFGQLLVVSPSVWWDDRVIISMVGDMKSTLRPRIWLDAGTAEGPNVVQDTRDLQQALLDKGWKDSELHVQFFEGAGHNERAWSERAGLLLRFVDTGFRSSYE